MTVRRLAVAKLSREFMAGRASAIHVHTDGTPVSSMELNMQRSCEVTSTVGDSFRPSRVVHPNRRVVVYGLGREELLENLAILQRLVNHPLLSDWEDHVHITPTKEVALGLPRSTERSQA